MELKLKLLTLQNKKYYFMKTKNILLPTFYFLHFF